ncbi:hypothetical protein K1T71_013391 [Dendrolimus kikuchii]|uniref:Uncharacterized protein n=1 Tax=Dendrolimus kikuchii TaxID=765133 RepID=A0ACC1CI92_9NEOP|nr:hypothetical protein K1T71_013391 [Dendrolimus kikuchii]
MNFSTEQFEKLLSAIGSQQRRSFASCKVFYDGTKDTEVVETFLSAASVFKNLEGIEDEDAIKSIPLILKDEAATWWNGIKGEISSWEQFQSRVRLAFAPKRPAYQIYQDIIGIKQDEKELTETFVTRKRALFAQLPVPGHTESQQLDMIYGQISYKIRSKLARETVKTYDELLKAARGVEQLLAERKPHAHAPQLKGEDKVQGKKPRCGYCRFPGHLSENCRRKLKDEGTASATGSQANMSRQMVAAIGTQAPSPSQPKFCCYGCGAPGVVRSKCPVCSKKPQAGPQNLEVGFCSINVQMDARPRPVIAIGVGKIAGTAYIDSCAKTSVASYGLYQCLKKLGYHFGEKQLTVTLADGKKTQRNVLTVRAPINLCNRIVPTTFIVFPESRESRTLLGIGFIQDAEMVLNIPQMTWHFIGEPDVIYELQEEDTTETSVAQVETAQEVFYLRSPLRSWFAEIQPPELISSLSSTPTGTYLTSEETTDKKAVCDTATTQSSSCAALDLRKSDASPNPALLETSVRTEKPYRLIPIDATTPPHKKFRTLFDGYSPRLYDYMLRDAQMATHGAEVELSPSSRKLFPSGSSSDDVDICAISIEDVISETLDTAQKSQLTGMLWKNQIAFGSSSVPTSLAEHCIDTGSHNPISVPPYRLSPPKLALLKEEIEKMLDEKIIEPCSSPWTAPVIMVPKKDGAVRVCVDYRRLNAITVPDVYPIPRIDQLLNAAKPTPFMSTLDLRAGYWQVKVKDSDQDKTAFIAPFGVYKFLRMPFGLRNAPSTFQRLIDRVKVSLEDIKMLAYLDDLIIFSSTYETHLEDLDKVLRKLSENNLRVNFSKCRFGCSTIKYLGHLITPVGLKVDPAKIAPIVQSPAPKNLKHLMTFLQTCSWFRRFIPNFSEISEPLTRLTRKKAEWVWKNEQETAFQQLKTRLTTAPILRQADETKPYTIKTDASNYAIGAVLMQGEGEDERPVEFASRLLNSAERNYNTTEKEALGVVWAITKFRGYVEGVPVTVITDHQALKWLMSLRSPTGRLARWALQIQAFDITIKYTPGRTNVIADTLSRPICDEQSINDCGVCSIVVDMPQRSPADIRAEQLKDEQINSIVTALEAAERTENAIYWSNKGFVMNNGLLYRYNPTLDSEEAQLVVPQHEWANVLAVYHDDPLAGHYGGDKTYQRIARRYHWKGMRKYIEAYVKNCIPCQRYKPANLKPAGLLQTTPINQRFETVAFDLFGPLPVTANGKTWIFIVEDLATGWVELFAMETASADNCAKILLDEICLRYGTPRRLISDNGPQFVSAVMQQLIFCLGIKHLHTPVYHPEANPVERKNKDMKIQLAILVEDDHRTWDAKLSSVRFAMNTANSLVTGHTPAYLTFARELRTPDDNAHDLRQKVLSENFVPEITPKLLQIADTLNRAREMRENNEARRKQQGDKSRRADPGYNPGDLVLASTHPVSQAARGISSKFCPRKDGPYLIHKHHGASSYILSDPTTPDKPLGVYHTSALSPYRGNLEAPPAPVRPLKKRGRPPKAKTAPTTTQSTRGRGRPRRTAYQ